MSETPSKHQPIELETIDSYTYDGTNANVVDEMPLAHITDTRDRTCLDNNDLNPNI